MTAITYRPLQVLIATKPGTNHSRRVRLMKRIVQGMDRRSRALRPPSRHDPPIAERPTSRLLLACPDRPGLIAAVSGFLADAGLNIVDADQHSSGEGRLFMRMVFDPAPAGEREALRRRFEQEVAGPLEMDHRFAESSERKRVAIMVSREDHCLSDLLWRWRSGELGGDVVAVISNHSDHADQVAALGLPFHHVPVEPGGKEAAERRALELLAGVDLLVLARYMQILSPGSCASWRRRRSTSTTASCPPSSAPTPTGAPTSAA